jgi:PAS domain S-box-containing protein
MWLTFYISLLFFLVVYLILFLLFQKNKYSNQILEEYSVELERYKTFSDVAVDWLWETDENNKFTYSTHGFYEATGKTRDELIGSDRLKFFEDNYKLVDKATQHEWDTHFEEFRNHRPFRNLRMAFQHGDGHMVTMLSSGEPRFDEEGHFLGYRGTALDISEIVKNEELAQASRSQLEQLFMLAPEAIIDIDRDLIIRMFNSGAERIFGYRIDEIVGRHLDVLIPPGYRSVHTNHVNEFAHSDQSYMQMNQRKEIAALRKDGTEFSAAASVSKYIDGSDRRFTVVLHDLTQQKEYDRALRATEEFRVAKEKAEEASRAKSEFLSSMTHELRTPLNSILGFSQLLEDESFEELSDDQRRYVQQILSNGELLLSLINDLLDLAKIEAGNLELTLSDIEPDELIGDCLQMFRPKISDRGISVTVDGPANDARVCRADSRFFYQVLSNLISNAIKYNEPDGRITINAGETREDMVRISITDTGKGIAEEFQDSLFDPFDRLGYENSQIDGTGIGLSIAKRLIEAMDGRIGVESEVGSGSTFWFELPKSSF